MYGTFWREHLYQMGHKSTKNPKIQLHASFRGIIEIYWGKIKTYHHFILQINLFYSLSKSLTMGYLNLFMTTGIFFLQLSHRKHSSPNCETPTKFLFWKRKHTVKSCRRIWNLYFLKLFQKFEQPKKICQFSRA